MTKMRVEINDELLAEAMTIWPEMSKSEVITLAIQRYIEAKRAELARRTTSVTDATKPASDS